MRPLCPSREDGPWCAEALARAVVSAGGDVELGDLEAAPRRHVDDDGIGPWERHELTQENATDLRVYGQPVAIWRVAVTTARFGQVRWELIEPLDDESSYAPFLAKKAGGDIILPSPRRASTTRWRRRPNGEPLWCSAARSAASRSHSFPPTVISG